MRQEIQMHISQNPEMKHFIRNNPVWYRYLARNPQSLSQLESEMKIYYGKTLPQRLDRFQANLNMAMMLIDMVKGLGASK